MIEVIGLSLTCHMLFQAVSTSDIVDLKYKSGVASLTINEVFPEDEGEYCCEATNSIGVTKTQCRLTVTRKLIWLLIYV